MKTSVGCAWWHAFLELLHKVRGGDHALFAVTRDDATIGKSQEAEIRYAKNKGIQFEFLTVSQFERVLTQQWPGGPPSATPADGGE